MKKSRIEYDKNTCVGTFACIKIDPTIFEKEEEKAKLKESEIKDGIQFIEKEFDDEKAKTIIEAADSCPVNAIKIVDLSNNETIINNEIETEEKAKEIIAEYDDKTEFVLDPNGYFLIRINKENKTIEVAFCKDKNKIILKVTGKTPIEIYQTILKENVISRKDHAAYLGRELQKAYTALQLNIDYIQDDELNLSKI